mmetsp:Transcript_30895/g.49851  ORF Transcript_30895/g.49851 Transcript_30895/m.49851 type:complete len:482 (+) Transcript_30895:124-1569(+)
MGKSGKERKRRKLLQEQTQLAECLSGDDDDDEPTAAGVSIAEAAAATKVLVALAAKPEAFKGKEFKALRASLHALRQSEGASMVLGFGIKDVSLTQVVSDALRDRRWSDATCALEKMRQRKQIPKLGSVQRWVRDCDAAADDDSQAMRVLDSVLRTADPSQVGAMSSAGAIQALLQADGSYAVGTLKCAGRVNQYPPWDAFGRDSPQVGETMQEAQAHAKLQRSSISLLFHRCFFAEGAARKPPNQHPLTIHTSTPGAIRLEPSHSKARRIEVPFVPGAFLIADLFTTDECRSIIEAGEAIGYDADEAAGGTSAADKQSILAHAFVWCTDDDFIAAVWKRVQTMVPQIMDGAKAVGINRRWRCYRYVPGSVYRAHIDGAWPGSSVDDNGEYVYDAFADGRSSRMTFLIYLNDDFEGGCTTFFTPSLEHGVLEARGVRPHTGTACMFPHGDAAGALLHEGSAVTAGAKYVVRTDVLYTPQGV